MNTIRGKRMMAGRVIFTCNDVHGLDDAVVEVRCGNEVGYGIIENMIFAPFEKYNFRQWGFKPA